MHAIDVVGLGYQTSSRSRGSKRGVEGRVDNDERNGGRGGGTEDSGQETDGRGGSAIEPRDGRYVHARISTASFWKYGLPSSAIGPKQAAALLWQFESAYRPAPSYSSFTQLCGHEDPTGDRESCPLPCLAVWISGNAARSSAVSQ